MNAAGYTDFEIVNGSLSVPISSGGADANGCFWFWEEVQGWDSADARVTMLPLISADGEIPADLHYRGRSIVLSGWVECPSEQARQGANQLLSAVMDLTNPASPGLLLANEVQPKQLAIVHAGNVNNGKLGFQSKGMGVKMSGSPDTTGRVVLDAVTTLGSATVSSATAAFTGADVGKLLTTPGGQLPYGTRVASVSSSTVVTATSKASASGTGLILGVAQLGGLPLGQMAYLADFQVEMYAQDPVKYGQTQHTVPFTAGSASCPNAGTCPSAPIIFLTTGGASPITLTLGARTLRLASRGASYPMPATVLVDFNAKTIVDGSGNNRYDLRDMTTPWWLLAPGANAVAMTAAASGTVAYYDSWR